MVDLNTKAPAFCTGDFINSDVHYEYNYYMVSEEPYSDHKGNEGIPNLNIAGYIPFVSTGSGAIRVIAAIAHIILHTFAAFSEEGHGAHILKGFAELSRGLVEMIPVAGNIICACHDTRPGCFSDAPFDEKRVWLVRITNYIEF